MLLHRAEWEGKRIWRGKKFRIWNDSVKMCLEVIFWHSLWTVEVRKLCHNGAHFNRNVNWIVHAQRLSTKYVVRGSIPGGDEIFHDRPDRPWGLPSLLCNGHRTFLGSKAAGAWRWPPTPSSAEVKERVEIYLYSPSEPFKVCSFVLILHRLMDCCREG